MELNVFMWISIDNVTHFTGLKPKHLKLSPEDTTTFNSIVEDWILQSQDLIKQYCNNYTTCGDYDVPPAVKNVCLRLVSNMVALAIARRDTPVTQPNDWTVTILSSEIFSQDLKDDLEPFVKAKVSGKADPVLVFTVTGEDLE